MPVHSRKVKKVRAKTYPTPSEFMKIVGERRGKLRKAFPDADLTFPWRHPQTIRYLTNMLLPEYKGKGRRVIINNIGAGMHVKEKSSRWRPPSGPLEPFELAKACKVARVDFRINATTFDQSMAEGAPKRIMEKEREYGKVPGVIHNRHQLYAPGDRKMFEKMLKEKKIRTGFLDLVNASPAQKADITVCLNAFVYLKNPKHVRLAFRHLADSVKPGGYLLIDQGAVTKLNKKQLARLGFEADPLVIEESVASLPMLTGSDRLLGENPRYFHGGTVVLRKKK